MNDDKFCKRCIGGKVMDLGDEAACINCGWRPARADLAREMSRLHRGKSLRAA